MAGCEQGVLVPLPFPTQLRTFSSMSAATGKQLKQSVKVLQSRMLYRRLHSS